MVWNEWWPHDPVPKSRVTDPYVVRPTPQQVQTIPGVTVRIKEQVSCRATSQCVFVNEPPDHKIKITIYVEFKPVMYVPQSKSKALLCGCKFSGNRPLCDGSHLWVKARRSMAKAAVGTFGFFFTMGVFTTWIFHP
ncbi:uncharacterized protein TOT_020000718 [Theileria orientalis strain Shintoku]|uniref:Iron-binding zinc finger CDGSH type domain-containing protein n=1 Tax=Theileria orientalis strain Shintoku TaxID=869250 RepID=J4CD37_THEOR|nr:uncharacterized protein TOT_020000718 [Theileria orientalis strain Shintoku]PVC52137.1 hypothetical protein MACL_00001013 [Theileria orientalis]BAM40462.1 uncharacterized protein TOT_020000718 [Theileria orientalis strain Shintoku]|eukprot:XP_009690763.1 uncharacterized protein TOT_020000718 [Theileria orientalis strain Shintoku]